MNWSGFGSGFTGLLAQGSTFEQVQKTFESGLSLTNFLVLAVWILVVLIAAFVFMVVLALMGVSVAKTFLAIFLSRIHEGAYGCLECYGRFIKVLPPGFYMLKPLKSRVLIVDTRQVPIAYEERCATQDNIWVTIGGEVQVRISEGANKTEHYENIRKAQYATGKPYQTIRSWFCDLLRSEIAKLNWLDVLKQREEIKKSITDHIAGYLAKFGYEIVGVQMTQFTLSPEIQARFEGVKSADLQRQAARDLAMAKQQAVVIAAESEAQAQAVRGVGAAQEQVQKAAGILEAMRAMTGDSDLKLAPQGAAALLLEMTRLEATVQASGSTSTKVLMLPNDAGTSKEVSQVAMAIVAGDELHDPTSTADVQATAGLPTMVDKAAAAKTAVTEGTRVAKNAVQAGTARAQEFLAAHPVIGAAASHIADRLDITGTGDSTNL